MSTLGNQIQQAINEFNALTTGDNWEAVQEQTFLPSLQTALNGAAAEGGDPTFNSVGAASVTADSVTIGTASAITNPAGGNLDISATGVLNATDTDTHSTVTGPDATGTALSVSNPPSLDLTAAGAASITLAQGADGSADVEISATDTDTQPVASATTGTASGDGVATTFTISHSLGVAPTAASVQPTSAAAAGDFHVSAKTTTGVDVTYATAPATGTGNLTWDVVLIE